MNTIIKDMKLSSETVADQVKYAMSALNIHAFDVLKADAKIARNCKIWNHYGDTNSYDIDIWADSIVKTWCILYSRFLSDAWSVSCDNYDEIASRMYIRTFIESR